MSGESNRLPLTNMRYINGWVVSFTADQYAVYKWLGRKLYPRRSGGDILYQVVEMLKKTGFYVISDRFFQEVNDPYLKGNKQGNRPHYYCLQDTSDGIYWMIPLSSQVEKYQRIIDKRLAAKRSCDTLHIVELDNNRKSAFLIQDLFPITEEYIQREYTVAGNHLMLTSEHVAREIEKKARKVIGMLKRGISFTPTQPNVLAILEYLKQNKTN